MMGEDTQKLLALRFPNSYHLFPELEDACSIAKTQNRGKAQVEFETHGLDVYGRLIVKCFKVGLCIFRKQAT